MKILLPKNFEPQKPLKIYDYQDVMISLFTPQIIPNQFNLEKLKKAEIIPFNWQLSKPVINQTKSLQFNFQEGLTMIFEMGKVRFFMKVSRDNINLSAIILKFINQFSNYNWQKLQINLRHLISLPGKRENGAKFMKEILFNSEKWDILGIKPLKTEINFMYSFPDNPLIINITDIGIKNKENKIKSGLLFKGIFTYSLQKIPVNNKRNYLNSLVNNYQQNLNIFNQVITENFLSTY